jgi:hypothetical protein
LIIILVMSERGNESIQKGIDLELILEKFF